MPTFENPATDADEVQRHCVPWRTRPVPSTTRARSTRCSARSPRGRVAEPVAASTRGVPRRRREEGRVGGGGLPSRAAATYQVSWELHRAGEILRQVSEAIASAHNAESCITYAHRDFPAFADALTARLTTGCRCEGLERRPPPQCGPRAPRRERRRDRRARKAAARSLLAEDRDSRKGWSEGEGCRAGGGAPRNRGVAEGRRTWASCVADARSTAVAASSGHGRPRWRVRTRSWPRAGSGSDGVFVGQDP